MRSKAMCDGKNEILPQFRVVPGSSDVQTLSLLHYCSCLVEKEMYFAQRILAEHLSWTMIIAGNHQLPLMRRNRRGTVN